MDSSQDLAAVRTAVTQARSGNRGMIARLLSYVEARGEASHEVARALRGVSGEAWTIGITGAPGAGKSTLTDRLVGEMLRSNAPERSRDAASAGTPWVAVLAVDPSSPFSGGAILGDRIRMQEHTTDSRVLIRSMATRGHLGGLSAAVPQAARVLDAVGSAYVVIETVGVGQVELEIAGHADTTVVVVNPGWGDAVQANKAGLMEIADVFVVNKADRGGADETAREIESMLMMAVERPWQPPVIAASAVTGSGVEQLWQAIQAHRRFLASGDGAARRTTQRDRVASEVRALLVEMTVQAVEARCVGAKFDATVDAVIAGELDPYAAAVAMHDGSNT